MVMIMKTLEELYGEILKSEELNKAFDEAVRDDKVEDFFKSHGCGAGMEEFAALLRERGRQAGAVELSDEALDHVSGGAGDGGSDIPSGLICPSCFQGDIEESTIDSPFFQMMYRTITRYTGRCRSCGYRWNYYTIVD